MSEKKDNDTPRMPRLELEIILRDKDGRIIDYRKQESKSWVANILRALRGLMLGGANNARETITTIDDLVVPYPRITSASDPLLQVAFGAGTALGIVIGTGTRSVSITDFNLASPIPHGTGSGQMQYGDTSISPISISGNTASFSITRSFINNSGASITVNEIGIIAQAIGSGAFLIARDLVSPGVSVPNGATLTVTYTITASA